MKSETFIILLVVLGFGGLAYYLLSRPPAPPSVVNTSAVAQCGASYVGVGASLPCNLIGQGVKSLYEGAKSVVQSTGIPGEAQKALGGIKPWEYVVVPVAITHATVNELKRLNPF